MLFFYRDAHFPLPRRHALRLVPVGGAGHQAILFHLVALERQQRLVDLVGERDQGFGRVARTIAGAVQHDLDAARRRLHAIASDPMAGGGKQVAAFVAQRQLIRAGGGERHVPALGIWIERAVGLALFFQLHHLPAHGLGCALAIGQQVEMHGLARIGKLARGLQLVAAARTFYHQLARRLDAVGRAIGRQHGQDVARGIGGRRQAEVHIAAAVARHFLGLQGHGEQAAVTQLAFDHGVLLATQGEGHLRVFHGFAIGVAQCDTALDRLARLEFRLRWLDVDFKVRLDVFGHAEGRAIHAILVIEAQFIAAGRGFRGQTEARVGARLARQLQRLRQQRRAIRIEHTQADRRRACCLRVARGGKFAAQKLDVDFVTGPVQGPIRYGINLGVVDFAVIVKILGHEHAAGAVLAQHIRVFRAAAFERGDAIKARGGRLQHTGAVGPRHIGARHSGAVVAPRRPYEHLAGRYLGHSHRVRHEHQRGGAVFTDDRFDQVQARLAFAQRYHHVAGASDDEVAAGAIELDAFRRRDGLGLPDRIAEAVDQFHALDRLVLRMVGEYGAPADRVIGRQLRLLFRDGEARFAGKQLAPGQARLLPPAIPQKTQGVGQAFALVIALDLDAVQIALLFQELHRFGHAVDDDVGARICFQVHASHVAARHLEAHARFIKTAITGVRQQEERFTLEGRVIAGLALLRGGAAQHEQRQKAHE